MGAHLSSYAFLALTACIGCAPAPEPDIYQVGYGPTQYLPLSGGYARDYIDEDVRRVPAAIRRCGARFLAFNGEITDGGEEAYFAVTKSGSVGCVKRALPQGTVEPAPSVIVDLLRKKRSN